MTQGGTAGMFVKNQPLMNDNNILKGDLEQVTKEDLRERLIVAEMVMKKLFQRNKELEDQAQSDTVKERTIEKEDSDEGSLQRRYPQKGSNVISPNDSKLESIEVTDIQSA